jgi:hypothetical protein
MKHSLFKNRQFGLALIIVALILSSGLHAQENWGPPENVIPFSWNDICPIRIYGFSYATISSNDSLMFVNFDCVYTHGVVSTVFENGEWQLPQPIHYQLDDILPNSLFFFDQGDTLLYFVADWTGGYGDEDIWAIQLVNDSWSDPFNLGPQINTAGEENSPSIPDDEIGLYFSRNDNIMYSEIVNGQFTSPVPLPPVINSDLTESHPRISRDGQKLYFNRAESWMHPDSTYVSYFINDTWQEPVPLNSNINCNHVDPNCPMITCSSYGPSFSGNGTKMFFTHFVVYGQFCEPGWGILASELITEVDPPQVPIPTNFSLSAYPNPFNSATNIAIEGNLEAVSEIAIYDITGRRIKSFKPATVISWDGTDSRGAAVSSGIYFVKVGAGNIEKSLRITFLK